MAVYTESRQLIDIHASQSLVSSRKIEPDKQRIPIVGHIITDQDIGAVEGNKLQPISLSRVAKLLTDPHSVHLYDRHVHALRKVAKHYQDGFLLKDLVPLLKILNVCADRSPTQRLYLEPMVELLLLCGLPFLKEKSSDEKAYEKIAVDSITQIGYLMRVNSSKVRRQICQSLISLYDSKQPPHKVQGLKPCDPSFNRAIIEQSQVAQSIIKSLQLIDDDPAMKLEIIKLLQKLSKQSPETCSKMLEVEAAKVVCSQLVSGSSQQGQGQRDVGELVFRSVEVLWNLLQDGEAKMVARQLNDFDCIRQLQEAFLNQLTSGYSVYDRQLRNDLLVILCLVATHCPTAPFLETQFSKQLVLLATFQEVKSHNALVKHLKLSACSEDFETKKLLVTLIVSLSADRAVLRQYSEGRLLLALFSYVRANDPSVVSSYEWSAAQFEEIQLHVMSALCTLCPLLLDDYMACQGNTRILLLIEWCIGAGDHCGGKGNSFYGSGTYKTKRAQLQLCVRLLYSVASTNHVTLLQDLADQGVIHQLTNILAGLQAVSPGKSMDDEADVTLQTDMLHTLAAVCDEDIHRKELFGNSGIDVLINYLKMDLSQLTLGLGHHRLLLAAVDAVWSCVCGCLTSEDYFLEREGAFLMLDLLESCPHEFRNVIIGCLMDLMENPKLIAHAMTWHSKQRPIVSIANLFCQLWRDEEALMGVQRDERGVIISTGVTEPTTNEMYGDDEGGLANGGTTRRPLVGTVQQSQGVISQAANAISPAIADVYDNIRSKIFAMFNKIGFVDLPGLTAEDHVTLTIVEHYLDFKIGEVWAETMAELAVEAVRPVTADREALEVINRTSSDRVDHVVNIQHELLNAQLAQDLQEEQQFYARIRESFRQSEKARNDFDKYVERTSNYATLKEAKALQDDMIDASRVQIKTNEPFTHHNVDIRNLTTTAFSGRHVTVHSTPAEMVGNSLSPSLGITALTSHTEEYETNYDTDRDVITFTSP